MKYIDADRLRKEIDHRIDILADVSIKCAKNDDIEMHNYYHGKAISLDELLSFIDSLQQEQPEVFDTVAFQKGVKEGRRLEREEPVSDCHDLKKHMKEWVELMVGASFPEQDGDFISEEDYRSVIKQTARHFAEWGAEHAKIDVTDFCKPIDPGIAQCGH